MNNSEPDYENPGVVRINSIAIALVLCFFATLGVVWLFGRGGASGVEPTPDDPPTFAATLTPIPVTPSIEEIAVAIPSADAERGSALFREYGCANCHSLDGSVGTGPPLDGGQRRVSETYTIAEMYLAAAILNPPDSSNEARGGYANTMPGNYGELLSAQDVADLVMFLMEQ